MECVQKCPSRLPLMVACSGLVILAITLVYIIKLQMEAENKTVAHNLEEHSDDFYVINNLFSMEDAHVIEKALMSKAPEFIRKSSPMRSGGALSLDHLNDTPIINMFRDHDTLKRIQRETGMRLQLVPRNDKNQISALLYSEVGDGIDEHRDGNVYLGTRWAGIYVVKDDQNSTFILNKNRIHLSPNSLLLFKGDKLNHQITRRTEKGQRLVLNILLCDVCAPRTDPLSSLWTFVINKFGFY